jgi:Flp pilus assembly pilin Flp
VVRIAQRLAADWAGDRGGQAGQGLAEYSLILALVAMAVIVALTMLGGDIAATLDYIGQTVAGSRP